MLGYILHKLRLKIFFVTITVLSCGFCIIQIILSGYFGANSDYPIIFWWTPFIAHDEIITCFNKYRCTLSQEKKHVNNTNLKAFLFYGTHFDMKNLPLPKQKIWAVFHEESPRNVGLFLYNRTYELFDVVSTFSRYSDFPVTLQYLENADIMTDTQYMVSVEEKNKFLGDISPVLYIQSDCDTPVDRDAYVREIMKIIPVDSYGKCLNNRKFPKEIAGIYSMDLYNDKLLKFIAKYKFVIAFENAICDDYITEKLWRPLLVGAIPIYLGSPSVKDWLPNKNSAILAKNFQNPVQLAHYVNQVDKNDSLYETFREHKYGKISNNFLKNALAEGLFGVPKNQNHPISAFECFICRALHDGIKKRVKKSFYDCLPPNQGWEYHWQSGDCQSKALVNSVKNNVRLETDPCSLIEEKYKL